MILDKIQEKQGQLIAICEKFGVSKLELFGSALTSQFNENTSDLDFVVQFDKDRMKASFFEFLDLKYALESLFDRPVDLVELHLLDNPHILRSVQEHSKLLYAA